MLQLRLLGSGHLHHTKIFLRDNLTIRKQPEFVPPGAGKSKVIQGEAKIGNLEPIGNFDQRQFGFRHQEICIQVYEGDFELVGSLGIRQAKIQAHLMVQKGKGQTLQVGEYSNQAFFLGRAVFNDIIAD